MTNAFTALWQDAVARLQPKRTLVIGPGASGLAASLLSLTFAWGGFVDLAWPSPDDDQPPRDGHRFTIHRARPQDAAGLLPVPGLVIVEAINDADAAGPVLAGLLNALTSQARRTARPYPVVLLVGLSAAGTSRADPAGAHTRSPARAAVEEFAAAEAADLRYVFVPLLKGAAVLAARDQGDTEPVQAILSGLAMGKIAQRAAGEAEDLRIALEAENAALRERCGAAEARSEYLYKAVRRAQISASLPAETQQDPPAAEPAGRLRPVLNRLLGAASRNRSNGEDQAPKDDAAIARLRSTPLLSAAWYRAQYPDVAASGVDPAEHYYRFGAAEGRNPGPDFVTGFYLAGEPVNGEPDANPLLHFLDRGHQESRWPNPDFDPAFYLAANPDVADAGLNPLEHFVAQGRAEGRRGLPPR